ncbi:hypothetical protein [Phenylobacterium sp. J367]|uniref:hypothetical protein n=1 Tax=Phenylobacterium sp. J367 TaxID=2898435 RepID=UPI002150EAF4|nr:hypothetical protein [Phenylobacterium sp. J367]MCR5879092.1 hypothetical protein [Phenylobacterium sp. J367]
MSPDQQHRCTVQQAPDGKPYLAFEPSTGAASSYSNSLFTLDLKPGVSLVEARRLADEINGALWGVSSTIF